MDTSRCEKAEAMDDSNNGSNVGNDGDESISSSEGAHKRTPNKNEMKRARREQRQKSYRSYSYQNRGVCRIEVAKVEWSYLQPWQRTTQMKSVGSGFVIDGHRLLTNAHVVKSAIDIRVRPHGSTRRYPAKVVVYAPDVDLAILTIKGETEHADFFNSLSLSYTNGKNVETMDENTEQNKNDSSNHKRLRKTLALEFATELPSLQESVHVVGFPTGGRTICVTEGVVSRIDLYDRIVAIQVDSAINPGNSGGPAFNSKGQVTG